MWRLRPVTSDDVDGLCALGAKPLVYRYLFDGSAPSRSYIASRVAQGLADSAQPRLGMWMLENSAVRYCGCVQLHPDHSERTAELTYLLDPVYWGRGLALRMAWTAMTIGFRSGHIDSIIAGADAPNLASFALMRRLGMRFHRNVEYPLGPGTEYIFTRDDPPPVPEPDLIRLA